MGSAESDRSDERLRMVAEIRSTAELTAPESGSAMLDARVLDAMAKVPRHEFVPLGQRHAAYWNRPLPIGAGQTISQPFIVALMTDLLQPKPDQRVLEVGTGCGYQAAVLSELVGEVYTVEIVESLGREAAQTLARLGYKNVHARVGDGYKGWPEHAPYDAIIVTAAAPGEIPPPLIEQLNVGGRLVIPVGTWQQELLLVTKNEDGTTTTKDVVAVRFVPLTRDKTESKPT